MNIKEIIGNLISETTGWVPLDFQIEKPKNNQADYSVNGAFVMAKKVGRSPSDIALEVTEKIKERLPEELKQVEASGGYINFFLSDSYLQKELLEISKQESFGANDSLKNKKVMIEYTDPNPFKLFHIGHLMSNIIGEAISRLYGASGAEVIRVNYQGDAGLHIAMSIWGMKQLSSETPSESDSISDKVSFLGKAYAKGASLYYAEETEVELKGEIEDINKKIYDRSDEEVNRLYDLGKAWSLEYFESIYKILGTKFNHYFFESEVAPESLKIVNAHKEIFKESEGAVVFEGENYGLHTRVFINSKGIPTYEAKELALNKNKFEIFNPDLSIIVTANEINEYFRVLLKVMSLIMPEVGSKTRHVSHGMMRLSTGKMSSRTGDVVPAEDLINQTKEKIKEKENEENPTNDETREAVAIGAIKYTILKQSPGKDIIFDFDTSLAVKGDSAPYLQYTYARLKAILSKSDNTAEADVGLLKEDSEIALLKHFLEFPDTVKEAGELLAPQKVALYIFQLAELVNNFYEKIRILDDENKGRMAARLILIDVAARIISQGLDILGIKTPERI